MTVSLELPESLYGCRVCGEIRRYPHEANNMAPLCRCADDVEAAAVDESAAEEQVPA